MIIFFCFMTARDSPIIKNAKVASQPRNETKSPGHLSLTLSESHFGDGQSSIATDGASADHKGYGEIEVFTSQSAHCIGIGRKDHVGHDQRGRHHNK